MNDNREIEETLKEVVGALRWLQMLHGPRIQEITGIDMWQQVVRSLESGEKVLREKK